MTREEEELKRKLIKFGELPAKEREDLANAFMEVGKYLNAIAKDLKGINDMRFLPIIMHQYLEFFMDNIINIKFKHPEIIFKKHHSFGFYEKCILLRAMGIFDGSTGKDLLTNIRIMTRIRNHYAHKLDISVGENIPEKIKAEINDMHTFDKIEWKDDGNFIEKYKYLSLLTFVELTDIEKQIKKDKSIIKIRTG